MKKLLLIITVILTSVSAAWAEDILPTATVGTYAFKAETLTIGGSNHNISNNNGDITISPQNNGHYSNNSNEFIGTIVIKMTVPETTTSNVLCELRTASNTTTSAQGLYMNTNRVLMTSWEGNPRSISNITYFNNGNSTTLTAGEHTIIYIASANGAYVVVDETSGIYFQDSGLKKSSVEYKSIYIPAVYAQHISELYFFSAIKYDADKTTIFTECNNLIHSSSHKSITDVSGKTLVIDDDATLSTYTNASNIFVATEKNLTVDVNNFDLTAISGNGNIVLDANTSITDNKSTTVTGKLTINDGRMLTIGSADSQTNSIASFSSIDLAGTIKHKNSRATLNNVTVPLGKTGKIHALDMGTTEDGFELAGTTTLNGNLIISNTYNLQMKVYELSGSGTWEIRGTDWENEDFNYVHTESIDQAVVNVASASSFTGTVNVNNSKATLTVSGILAASTIKKTTGILKYAGTTLNGTKLDGAVLTGSTYITTSGEVTIKNLEGNNVGDNTHGYTFVGNGDNCTIKFSGACDLTKKSDGSTSNSNAKVGYNAKSFIEISENANVKVAAFFNTGTDNASITINEGAIVTCTGTLLSTSLQGSGNIILGTFPNSTAPNISNDWTGSIEFATTDEDKGAIDAILNAWGNANSKIILNGVGTTGSKGKGQGTYFNGSQTINPKVEMAAGTIVYINNGNSNTTGVFTELSGAGTLKLEWSGTYNQKITKLTNFSGTLDAGTNNRTITVDEADIALNHRPSLNEKLFETSGSVIVSGYKLSYNWQELTAYTCAVQTYEGVTGFYVTSKDLAQEKREKAIFAVEPYKDYIGTGVNHYSIYVDGESELCQSMDAFNTAIEKWTEEGEYIVPDIRLNQPTSGYYKIKSSDDEDIGYYISCENIDNSDDSFAKQTTSTNENNIFYIDYDETNGTIKSYSTGKYFGYHTRANYTTETNCPAKWTFGFGRKMGTYTLTSDVIYSTQGNLNGQILYGWNGTNETFKVDRYDVQVAGHTDWILIPVAKEDLPVISAPGSTTTNPVILGNITSTDDVTDKIDANAKFIDLSDATISASIDEIKAEVEKINPNAIIIAPEGTSVASTTTNVLLTTDTENTYTCNNLQLNDDVIAQFTTEATTFQNTNVTYTRASSASVWGTICLPYATSTQGDISYYRLVESSTSNLRFEKISDANTTAYEPYLIKKEAGAGLSVSAEGQEFNIGISGPQNGSSHNNYKLQGVLVNTSVINGTNYTSAKEGYDVAITDPNAYYFVAADNTFRKLNGRFNLKAFRAYLTATSANARENIGIDIFDNDQPTGISFVESEDGKTVDVIFDLNGRRLQNAKKGINIINGKKVIK
jgi:hypothetical protein